jgi:leucyl aminopeptidase (aminopeptidase T)
MLQNQIIAEKVVKTCLKVKKNDQVWIEATSHTLDLAGDIFVECYKTGASPLLAVSSDEIVKRFYDEVPLEHIGKPPQHFLNALDVTTVFINMSALKDPSILANVSAAKMAALLEARKTLDEKILSRRMKVAMINYGYVSLERAKAYEIDYDTWRKSVLAAMAVDYKSLTSIGKKIRAFLNRHTEVRIVTSAGTNISFRISHQRARLDDGVIDEEDIQNGFLKIELPAGWVGVPIDPGTANGVVIFDQPIPFRGKLVKRLKIRVDNGKITFMDAQVNLDILRDMLEKASGDKDKISFFGFGINPNVKPITSDPILYNKALGVVNIGIGDNRFLGGSITSSWSFDGSISGATVEIDGNPVMIEGKFRL